MEERNAVYHFNADGTVEWVHIRAFDVSKLKARFAIGLEQLFGQQVAAMVLSDPSIMNPLFRVSANTDRVYRFEHNDDTIQVTTGFGNTADVVSQILFNDLPEKLPWWLKHLVAVQNTSPE